MRCPCRFADKFIDQAALMSVRKAFDLASHRLGLPGQLVGGLQNLMGRGAGIAGSLLDTARRSM